MIRPKITNKLRGSLGEIYYKEYCDQRGWAYISLENLYDPMHRGWSFTFKKGFHRVDITIPKELQDEISWLVKPTNNSLTSPSFVFDFLVCKVETSKNYSKIKAAKSFAWAEIKTGKGVFSAGQIKAMSKITSPLAIFHIIDVLKAPENIEMKWSIKSGSEWLQELEPIDNEIYEFANPQAVR